MDVKSSFNNTVAVNRVNTRRSDKKIASEIEKLAAFSIENALAASACEIPLGSLLEATEGDDFLTFLIDNADSENLCPCIFVFNSIEVMRMNIQIKHYLKDLTEEKTALPDGVEIKIKLKNNSDIKKLLLSLAFYNLDYTAFAFDGGVFTLSADVGEKKQQFLHLLAFLRNLALELKASF